MPAAEREIRDTLWLEHDAILEGIETGGGLYAKPRRCSDDGVFVDVASRAGARASREPGRVVLSSREMRDVELELRALHRTGEVRIGDFHVHPSGHSGIPSTTDVMGWRAQLDETTPMYVGLIVTGERGWTRPTYHGWLVTRSNIVERHLGGAMPVLKASCGRRYPAQRADKRSLPPHRRRANRSGWQ